MQCHKNDLRVRDTLKCINKIGFIGLGNMGGPMARNLLKKGKKLSVFDVQPEVVNTIAQEGATACSCPEEVAAQSDCIVTMLPHSASVRDTYTGERGIFKSVSRDTFLIDCSTIDRDLSVELSEEATKRGCLQFDAPVSGGVVAAKEGKLTFMVGGPDKYFETVKDLLLHMGSRAVHCGPVGSGQTVKMCNNMLLAISMIGTAEAMNLGIRLGLKPNVLMEIFNTSSGRCWSSEQYNPVPGTISNVPSANNYEGGFGTHLMAKDLGIAQEASTKNQVPTPLGSLAHQIYRILVAQGYGKKDFSVIYKFLSEAK
ncbi:3-hydroxyisobutyrate dehydrogenase, mitochondrial isoform X1 [Schistocerca gregaria]|uniref:3-hydroxyisobutyrate dehydrogenase, mitochondrial isoform X1 n=1 Tax=Schistocerca gregaria TaxID=7010 RepID=UPI00211E6214|nr:3-hydroxyisobutyrate dehydrogenase, mitochondrial isoform X1 [Schistocerca gregaria]